MTRMPYTPGPYGPWKVRGRKRNGTPVVVWIFLKRDDDGNPVPALRIDDKKDDEVTLDPVESAQLIMNVRNAWNAVGDIKLSREAQAEQDRRKRGPSR